MRKFTLVIILSFLFISISFAQERVADDDKKHGVVWSTGLFKSWLKDTHVGFDKIGDKVTPVFSEQKKIGLMLQSHYMYRPVKYFGIGLHLGLGLDVYSNVRAPVVLFGGSFSIGDKQQLIIDFGWADGKRKIVPDALRSQLLNEDYQEIPELFDHSELNTGLYIGVGYKIF